MTMYDVYVGIWCQEYKCRSQPMFNTMTYSCTCIVREAVTKILKQNDLFHSCNGGTAIDEKTFGRIFTLRQSNRKEITKPCVYYYGTVFSISLNFENIFILEYMIFRLSDCHVCIYSLIYHMSCVQCTLNEQIFIFFIICRYLQLSINIASNVITDGFFHFQVSN